MNREILFRGKLSNGDWAYGNLRITKDQVCIITPDDTPIGKYGQVDHDTVGQYINLQDKSGKKAFDGDISKNEQGGLWVIFLTKGGYATCTIQEWRDTAVKGLHPILFEPMADAQVSGCFEQSHEIVGNIHDNPELGGGNR